MAVTRVVLLLALASLLAVNAATPRFVDFISSGPSAKIQANGDVDTTSVCLQQVAEKSCRCMDAKTDEKGVITSCVRGTGSVKLSCCQSLDGDKFSSAVEDLMSEQPTLGACDFTEEYFHEPITYQARTDVAKIGQFEASCELHENANTCGETLNEGTRLIVKGDILSYDHVAFMHSLVDTPQTDGCRLPFPTSAVSKTPVKIQKDSSPSTPLDGTTFLTGPGHIFSGVFSAVNRNVRSPFSTGQFQMIKHTPGVDRAVYTESTHPPEKTFVAKDGAIALDFFRSE